MQNTTIDYIWFNWRVINVPQQQQQQPNDMPEEFVKNFTNETIHEMKIGVTIGNFSITPIDGVICRKDV